MIDHSVQPMPVPIDDALTGGACPLYAQMCPDDDASQLIAFVCNGDIYVQHGAHTIRATYTGVCHSIFTIIIHLGSTSTLSAGAPAYVAQEEFDRYTAMWWCPHEKTNVNTNRYLLYEQIDETSVQALCITSPGTQLEAQLPMRYPLAGTANALSSLKMLEICIDNDMSMHINDLFLSIDLHAQFPWFEYLIRAGWIRDGTAYVHIIL